MGTALLTLAGLGSGLPSFFAEDPQVEGSAERYMVFIANGSHGTSEVTA